MSADDMKHSAPRFHLAITLIDIELVSSMRLAVSVCANLKTLESPVGLHIQLQTRSTDHCGLTFLSCLRGFDFLKPDNH